MALNIKPLGDRLLVEPVEEKEVKKGGIIIPDTAKEKPQEGIVRALGTGKLDDKWVEEEMKRLGRNKKGDEKKPEVAKKEDPYKGASPPTTRLLDEAKRLEGITNDDLLRLRKLADMADGMGDWAERIIDRLAGEIRRMRNADELRRRLDEIEGWLNGPGGNDPGGWPRPGGGGWPGGGRPGGGRPGGGGGRGGGR